MNAISINLKKKSGIYCLINTLNSKRYIGSSVNIFARIQKHRSLLRGNKAQNRKLQYQWNKYGESNFNYYVLEFCSEIELEKREQFYIDSLNPELNITKTVERNILSKESRKRQSETRKRLFKEGSLRVAFERPIHQYGLDGIYIASYVNIKTACIENNIAQSTVHRFLNGEYKKGGNYLWSYKKVKSMPKYEKYNYSVQKIGKRIKCIDIKTKKIKTFKSITECYTYFNCSVYYVRKSLNEKCLFLDRYMLYYITA